MSRRSPALQARADALVAALTVAVPTPRCELDHVGPFQLLIATILSAQTTDKGVNKVTPELFGRYPDPAAMADAEPSELEEIIRPTGFYKTKAKHLRETARALVERHGSEVPRTIEALVELPGVARKTANVVLGTAFGIASGVTVDTHVGRVARRLRLTRETDPVKVEAALVRLLAPERWIDMGHRMVLHGRYTCLARKPRCSACACREFCPSRAPPRG